MSDAAITKALKKQIADLCGIDEAVITDGGKLAGYGLDSVRVLDLLFAMEEEFDIELSEHDPGLAKVETLTQLAAHIQKVRDS